MHQLPQTGYLRLPQIVGNPKAEPPVPAIIPVSKSTWWQGVKEGRYPKPVKLRTGATLNTTVILEPSPPFFDGLCIGYMCCNNSNEPWLIGGRPAAKRLEKMRCTGVQRIRDLAVVMRSLPDRPYSRAGLGGR